MGRRAWIGDGTRGALIAADATIDWFCPETLSGPAVCWHLHDPNGGAVRVGPVRDGSGAGRRLPASSQGYHRGTNVVETVLEASGGRAVSIVDVLPWPGPGLTPSGKDRALGPSLVEVRWR